MTFTFTVGHTPVSVEADTLDAAWDAVEHAHPDADTITWLDQEGPVFIEFVLSDGYLPEEVF